MAQYKTLQYGSTGDEVKKLQQQLSSGGYRLETDGQYGPETQSAVIDYQQKNGLKVDGVVGDETWGKLESTASAPETETASEAAAYTSPYDSLIRSAWAQIQDRKDQTYDLGADTMYQQYRDQYTRAGQRAMEDTMAKAAHLTGGYGSTYAAGAGQQMYDQYLQELNALVPELLETQREAYDRQTQGLYDWMSLLQTQQAQDYARWQDAYARSQDQAQQEREAQQQQFENALALYQALGYATGDVARILGIPETTSGGSGSGSTSSAEVSQEMPQEQILNLAMGWVKENPGKNLSSLEWQRFRKASGLTGEALTKLDSTTRYILESLLNQKASDTGGATGANKNRVHQFH